MTLITDRSGHLTLSELNVTITVSFSSSLYGVFQGTVLCALLFIMISHFISGLNAYL